MFELNDSRRDELIELWAKRIVDRGLASAAVFLLQAHVPLAGIGAQALIGFRPLVESFLHVDATELAAFLRQPDNIELLVGRIEQLEREQQDQKNG
jgi:hypothetical protein